MVKRILYELHSSSVLPEATGLGLAEECSKLGDCRTGTAKVINTYDLPARRVIHTVGPKYALKYHTVAETQFSNNEYSLIEKHRLTSFS